jgi:hypothetical protein
MFKKMFIITAMLFATSCYSQVLTVEQYSSFIQNHQSIPSNVTQVRDISGIYNNYLGHWRYMEGSKQIDFYITEEVHTVLSIVHDAITVRYEIRENGQIVLDNTNLSIESPLVIKTSDYTDGGFFNSFLGINSSCFKRGMIYFKYNQNMDFTTGAVTEELDVYPSYYGYKFTNDNCSTYQAPFPDYFIMQRM